jgi:hypothetical protein
MREAMAMLTITDDAGHRYRPRVEAVSWERVPPGRQEWRGDLVADADPQAPRPAWLEIASIDAPESGRITLGKAFGSAGASARPAVAAAPRWPTPAEGFLDALARVGDVKVGWTDVEAGKTAEIVAVVADCLLAVGALPPGSELLRPGPAAPHPPTWQDALAARWARRAHLTVSAAGTRHRVLLSPLPLEHASAVVETVYASGGTAAGTLVGITLHGSPWVPGAAWPLIAPCFSVYARDDDGRDYEGVLAGFRQGTNTEGTGTFWLWPPVADKQAGDAAGTTLTVTIATLWEAARIQVPLPR